VGGGAGAGCDSGSPADVRGREGNTDAEESPALGVTSVITGIEVTGSFGTPAKPGMPNWGNAGRPSRAVRRLL